MHPVRHERRKPSDAFEQAIFLMYAKVKLL